MNRCENFRPIRLLLSNVLSKYKSHGKVIGVRHYWVPWILTKSSFFNVDIHNWILFFAEHACVKYRLKQTYLHDHQIWRTVQTNKQSFTEKIMFDSTMSEEYHRQKLSYHIILFSIIDIIISITIVVFSNVIEEFNIYAFLLLSLICTLSSINHIKVYPY